MNYCILRAKKLSAFGSIAGSAKHNLREIPVPNADATRTHLNWTSGARSAAAVCAAIKARLPEKRRKDAVLAIEYLITASPEWFKTKPWKQQRAYFNASIDWLRERHGADNLVCVNLQRDERSPHLIAYAVARTKDGRLSATDFLGGRHVLSEMQTDFWTKVGRPAGLVRGLQGSTAKHTTAKQYSAALAKNPALTAPAPPAPTLIDWATGRARQMREAHRVDAKAHAHLVEQARADALLVKKARDQRAQELVRLRSEAAELQGARVEAARLADENSKLVLELGRQRKYFDAELAALKALLEKAKAKIESLLIEVGSWKREEATARAEADDLRRQLNPAPDRTVPAANV